MANVCARTFQTSLTHFPNVRAHIHIHWRSPPPSINYTLKITKYKKKN